MHATIGYFLKSPVRDGLLHEIYKKTKTLNLSCIESVVVAEYVIDVIYHDEKSI